MSRSFHRMKSCSIIVLFGGLVASVLGVFAQDAKTKPANAPRGDQSKAANSAAAAERQSAKTSPQADKTTLAQRKAAVHAALEKRMDVHFEGTPLKEVLKYLEDQTRVPFVSDKKALDAAGIGTDAPVTFHVADHRVRSTLDLILQRFDLTWYEEPDVITITTMDEVERRLDTSVLSVADLVPGSSPEREELRDELLSAITGAVGRPSPGWEQDGGVGVVNVTDDGQLVVTTIGRIREDVAHLIDALHKARQPASDKSGDQLRMIPNSRWRESAKLRQALEEMVTIEFSETPLIELAELVSTKCRIPIQVDRKELDAAGVGTEAPVTGKWNAMPLGEALRRTLKQFDLTWMLSDDVVLITTPDRVERQPNWIVYPVADLVPEDEFDLVSLRMEQLIDLITQHTGKPQPDWDMYGGVGTVSAVSIAKALVVATTDETHHEVRRLLDGLRKNREHPPGASTDAGTYVRRSYQILRSEGGDTVVPADGVAKLLEESLPADTWKRPPLQLGDRLIVEQTIVGHRKLERLIRKLGLPVVPAYVPKPGPSMPGMGAVGGFF